MSYDSVYPTFRAAAQDLGRKRSSFLLKKKSN
jgi:hypothetical protein